MNLALARFLSIFFHPLLLPTYLFALILYALPESLITFPMDKRWIILATIFFLTFIIPALGAYFMVRAGVVNNLHMQDRLQRRLPFLFTTLCYASTTYILGYDNIFGDLFYYIMLLILIVLFILLTGAVMSARLALHEHSPAQVYAGLFTGFAIGAGLILFL